MKALIKNNLKFIIVMSIVITLGIIGIAFAFIINGNNPILIGVGTAPIVANITFDENSNGDTISSDGDFAPIARSLISHVDFDDIDDSRVIKAKFIVSGASTNPDDVIFDIVLKDIDMDCELKSAKVRWLLLKYNEDDYEYQEVSSGTFSPTFDIMANNKLVLTNTQEDLTEEARTYGLLIWIDDTCWENIDECFYKEVEVETEEGTETRIENYKGENELVNRNFSASIKLEVSAKTKKELARTTSPQGNACVGSKYISVPRPACKSENMYYVNGEVQLLQTTDNVDVMYTVNTTTGVDAGDYIIRAKLMDGYIWSGSNTDDYEITCTINKRDLIITTIDQYEDEFTSDLSKITITSDHGLAYLEKIHSINLYMEDGQIKATNAIIWNNKGRDVTYNYDITYDNIGSVLDRY